MRQCVKPTCILLYGSELWPIFEVNLSKKLSCDGEYTLEKTFENVLPETVHPRFCKYILGVSKYVSNKASKAELALDLQFLH